MMKTSTITMNQNIGMKQITVAMFKVLTFQKEEMTTKNIQIQIFV